MTVHAIPADHLDAARGGVLVVDGDLVPVAEGLLDPSERYISPAGDHRLFRRTPPVEFVKLTEPCKACDGSGHATFGNQVRTSEKCPACDGSGRPLLRVDVLEYGGMSDDGPGPWKADSFRTHVLDVVPIINNSNDWEHGHIDHIDVMGDTYIRRTPTEGFTEDTAIITLPPGDHVGRYAVLIEPESRET